MSNLHEPDIKANEKVENVENYKEQLIPKWVIDEAMHKVPG